MSKSVAVFFILLGSLFSSTDDVFQRLLATKFSIFEIMLFRHVFSMIFLLPFMIYNRKLFQTKIVGIHILRGFLFFVMLFMNIYGLTKTCLSLTALIVCCGPIFIMILSKFFLKEQLTLTKILVASITFLAILLPIDFKDTSMSIGCLFIIAAQLIYAIVEVINKKLSATENSITMIFYYNLFALIFSLIASYNSFIMPNTLDFIYLICLGIGSNLFFYFSIQAFKYADISFLSPFKYSEFIYKNFFGLLIFKEITPTISYISMLTIVIFNTYLLYHEKKIDKKTIFKFS